jgi:ligand-binding sensor domain-containing protein/serine phosphatase RsbU (regulator of sigma subunit)
MQDRKRITETVLKNSIWILLCTAMLLPANAQKLPFSNYTIQDGLPNNTVNGICQDTDGYIWFATQVGAARYDGYEFTFFNISNGLPDNFVNCILAGSNGYVWFGTEQGIARYDGSGFKLYSEKDGLVSNRVDRLVEDHSGNIWAVTVYGISVLTSDTVLSYTKEDALTDNTIKDIFVDSRGWIHVATYPVTGLTIFQDPFSYKRLLTDYVIWDIAETKDGRFWYATQNKGIMVQDQDGEDSRMLGYEEGLTDEIVLSLMVDHLGRVWCGTYVEGLFVCEDGVFRKVSSEHGTEPLAVEIFEDSKHRVWIMDNQDGVWLKDQQGLRNYTMANDLVYDIVTDIMEDKYGNIWLATLSGVSKYGRVIFEVFDSDVVLPENNVISTFFDSRERLWFGTYGHLLYMKENTIYMLEERNGFIQGTNPLSFAEDNNKNIYIGTDKGLLYFNGRSLIPLDYWGQNSVDIQFFSLLHTNDQKLWCGTDSGLYILNGTRVEVPLGNRNLADPQVNAMDRVDDRVYCATEGGVSVFDIEGHHLANYTTLDSLSSNVCNDITHDVEGNIWVATDRGLSKITNSRNPVITNYNMTHGLTSSAIYFLVFNDSTSLWLGTDRGLFRFNTNSGETEFYGIEDGFYPLDTYRGAATKGSGKELWMGTVSGLVHYLPAYDITDTVPPDLILFPPIVDGQEYIADAENGELHPSFPYNKNSLVFNFTAIHTTIPTQNSFSFYLEGYDDDWSEPVADRTAVYRKIPNGNYVFKLMAFNLDGTPTDSEASFAFSIKPPFWKTIWFILLEIIAGLSLVYGTIKYRERQLIREKRVLEVKVKERTREIEEQKVEIEAQRDEISEQKNFVENQRDQIALQNKEITDSIQYARHIQQAVLPGKLALEKTLPEHFILFKPRDIVSGDFFWVDQKNDRIIVCAADCTGHGVPGAFMSLLGLTFLNEIVNKDEILKASEILNRLRIYIINAMSHKDSQARDGMDLSLVIIDKQLNMMEYAGAYNPLVIIRGEEMIEYKADKMPIGKHVGEEHSFTNHKLHVQNGDVIYLFTDGFPDQFGGEKGGKYKARPFKRLLQEISTQSMKKQEKLLEHELQSWMGETEQVDDILVMGMRYITI